MSPGEIQPRISQIALIWALVDIIRISYLVSRMSRKKDAPLGRLDPSTPLGTSTIASACAFGAKFGAFLTGLTGLTYY